MIHRAGDSMAAAGNLRPFKGRARRRCTTNQLIVMPERHLAVGADIHKQRRFRLTQHAAGQHCGCDIRADKRGDATRQIAPRRERKSHLFGIQHLAEETIRGKRRV
ncbi:hypothetical protein SDC9_119074 [bioreactor metagenome]|uniref:Uncharacterized protein n=1 Tax=bioreactor metagenome TaxID=1076179 RepID=A0A645C548_9ZZZZ